MAHGDAERVSEPDGAEAVAWHALAGEAVLGRLGSTPEGLAEHQVAAARRRHGPNVLDSRPPKPWWRVLLDQVKSLVVLLLAGAAVLAAVVGDPLEALAIFAVLAINLTIGFTMEWQARQAMEALRRLQVQEATVLRAGRRQSVDARDLVPGDVLCLEAGTAVAADARLLTTSELRLVEAPLTGESVPVAKSADPVDAGAALPERTSMVYKGTLAAAGSGEAVVVATGSATEIGRIGELGATTETGRTPLERRLDVLGRRLVWLTLGVAAVVTLLGVLRGEALWLMVETGIALAIAAVPEGLPVVATLTLALGMRRMARRRALVRRLPAVETLGSATVVCADKTGTLTAGEMTVTLLEVGGERIEITGGGYRAEGSFVQEGREVDPAEVPGLELALTIGALVNRADLEEGDGGVSVLGDPTEAALLVAGAKGGLEREALEARYPPLGEVPFTSERMLMATFHQAPDGGRVLFAKGAPRRVLERSGRVLRADRPEPLGEVGREALLEANRRLAGEGLRVLALASRALEPDEELGEAAIHDLTFIGLVGMIDPPAPGVEATVAQLRRAGVRTVMITGDQVATAEAVGRGLGVLGAGEETVDGREMAQLSEAALAERVGRVGAFARVSPEDKLRIVEAFRARGEIVGMLGDGVNDAPALKRADIGVAMGGRGTDVAKETASLVLQDDRFETVAAAVEEGRVIFDNIRKFIFYLFSCNLSEVTVVFLAGLLRLPLPLLPLQILWLNLVTDVFPALALGAEPAEPDVMERPPRDPGRAILSRRFVGEIAAYGGAITAATLGVFLWGLLVWRVSEPHAVTLAFMTLALAQLFHVFNARSPEPVLAGRRFFTNRWVWGAIVLTLVLQLAAVYLPGLSGVLETHPLGLADWGLVLACSLAPLVLGQVAKAVRRRQGE